MKIFGVGDWQDDIRSSLYTHFWCSYTRTRGLVVKASGNLSQTLETWVQYLEKSYFWIFKFSSPLIFSCVLEYIYTHLDWNINNHCGLVALFSVSWAHLHGFNSYQVRMSWEVLWGYQELLMDWWVHSEETKALVGGNVRMNVDILRVTLSCNLSQRKKTKFWYSTWSCFLRHKQDFLFCLMP